MKSIGKHLSLRFILFNRGRFLWLRRFFWIHVIGFVRKNFRMYHLQKSIIFLIHRIVGLCCDTTASNTGKFNNAAVLIEQLLEIYLLLFKCRHHIFEVILKVTFDSQIFNSSGSNVLIFMRFKKEWDALNLTKILLYTFT